MDEVNCPQCGTAVFSLQDVDPTLKDMLKSKGKENVPSAVCSSCLAELSAVVGRGGLLYAREKQKENNRLMLWKSRVELIKNARRAMAEKMYAEAVIFYEKYIRVLEIVFQAEQGQLKPELFTQSTHVKELTVIASVYWDLMRIYDTSSQYSERQQTAAKQLANFVRFTPIFPDIIRKAQSFEKSAKNRSAFKSFLKLSNSNRPRCFIATSAFEYPMAPEVITLRKFRDEYLRKSNWGKKFILYYYRLSPKIAGCLDRIPALKPLTRWFLRLLIFCVKRFL